MEDIQCIFCNKSSDQIAIEEDGYQGRKCPSCGLIYISPRPALAKINDLYSQDQAHTSAEWHISRAFGKRLYAKHNLRIIEKYVKKGSLLEIGPGAGYFLDEARKRGFQVYGVELNKTLADFVRAKLGIPCEESPLSISSFDGKKFDIIYHCDVISHFYDPIAELEKINARLIEDGILVFQTGNGGDMKAKYYKLFATFDYPDHLFLFGENNLKELLRRTGFELVEIHRYSIVPQLMTMKILRKAIDFIRPQEKTSRRDKNGMSGVPTSVIRGPGSGKLMWNMYDLFAYLIRYKIGYVSPKEERPQTVIVVARKGK